MWRHFAVFTILLCATLASARAGQSNAPDKPLTAGEQSLISAEKTFMQAARKGDVAFLKRTLADDFSFVGYDGQLASRQDMIDQIAEGPMDLMPYDMKVVTLSEDSAIVTYDVVLRVPPAEDQGAPPRYQHISTVWTKQGGAWKMKFQQMSVSHWGDW